MPRKQASAEIRELHGRRPGYDSGGRPIRPTRARQANPPPRMPSGLPVAVRREWRRVVKELTERDPGCTAMPSQDVLLDYCRTCVRQRQVAVALDDSSPGTVAWSRLSATEDRLAKRIAAFCAKFFDEDTIVDAPAPVYDRNPFGPADPVEWARIHGHPSVADHDWADDEDDDEDEDEDDG